MYTYAYIYIYIHTYVHIYIHTYIYIYIYVCVYTHTHTHHTFSCALQSYAPSQLAEIPVALGLPSGPACLACWACLGLSPACLGPSTAFPGLQGAIWTSFGRQVDASWTPNGRQLDCQNGCQCQHTSSRRQDSCRVPQNALPTALLSPDGDNMQH